MTSTPESASPATVHQVVGLAEFSDHAVRMVGGAHAQIMLFTHAMDHRIYGSEAFCEALKHFILGHRRAQVQVLVHTPANAMRQGHRLVELGRRLSSRIEFRQLIEERRSLCEEYLLVDERALLHKEYHADLEARYYANDPLRARQQRRDFDALWQESPPAREFTELKL